MIRRLYLLPGARADVRDAAHWYEAQRSGLGIRLLHELDQLCGRIANAPLQFPEIEAGVRRGLLRRFPYAVYFVVAAERIDVVAVLHLHRTPATWKRRT